MLVQTVHTILLQGCQLVETGTDCMHMNKLTTCISKWVKFISTKELCAIWWNTFASTYNSFPYSNYSILYCITQNITIKQHMTWSVNVICSCSCNSFHIHCKFISVMLSQCTAEQLKNTIPYFPVDNTRIIYRKIREMAYSFSSNLTHFSCLAEGTCK
jgi:hypothetical protein